MAGDNFMLPPLIRDVDSLEENARHTYYSLTDAECVRFIVQFDEAYVDDNKFPLKKLPLRFRCELCDLDFQQAPLELGEIETRALIRAFFLGVKLQILAKDNKHTGNYDLRIQLSSTLFLECGELIDNSYDPTAEDICNQVSLDLYSKSSDFFGSPQDGTTVWRVRVAQELFGEPKPAAEVFWPLEAEMSARRGAIGNALSLAVEPVLAVAAVAPLAIGPSRARASVLSALPRHLERGASLVSAVAAVLTIGVAGLILGGSAWNEISSSPERPTLVARTAAADPLPDMSSALSVPLDLAPSPAARTPVTLIRFGDICEGSEQQVLRPTPLLGAAPGMSSKAKPALSGKFVGPPEKPVSAAGAVASTSKQSEALRKKSCVVIKTVPSHPDRGKPAVRVVKRNPSNPLVVVRRAVTSIAARIAKDFRRLPYQLSSLMTGR
jgi:hypothetical protein